MEQLPDRFDGEFIQEILFPNLTCYYLGKRGIYRQFVATSSIAGWVSARGWGEP